MFLLTSLVAITIFCGIPRQHVSVVFCLFDVIGRSVPSFRRSEWKESLQYQLISLHMPEHRVIPVSADICIGVVFHLAGSVEGIQMFVGYI